MLISIWLDDSYCEAGEETEHMIERGLSDDFITVEIPDSVVDQDNLPDLIHSFNNPPY